MKFISILIIFVSQAYLQEFSQRFSIPEITVDQIIQFDDSLFIVPNTEQLITGSRQLKADLDYRFNYALRRIRFLQPIELTDSLEISFSTIPLKKQYQLTSPPPIYQPNLSDSSQLNEIFKSVQSRPASSSFSNISSSGSIYRGFRLTSNQDLKLESGLNLNLEGNLSKDITISAAITDEATPIQPEGSTQNLSEIDKIYIDIKGPDFNALLGDFDYSLKQDNILNYDRRLNGISLLYKADRLNAGGIISSSRSQFHRNQLLTREGLQGPYKLSSPTNNLDILVIAGSEKVYLDGQLQQRGSNNDYIIEYADGTIRFTGKRIIRANQRLEVEFEYVEALQRFGRNVYQAESDYQSKSLSSRFIFIQEADDINNPISTESAFTEAERQLLKDAGTDQIKASVSSVQLSTNASTGLYDYEFNPTIVDSILVYRALRDGRYNASFANVGLLKGSYKRVSRFNNHYEFVGLNQGDYEPVRFIPIPKKQSVIMNISQLNYSESDYFKLSSAISINDQNIFSQLDDESRDGVFFDFFNLNQVDKLWGFKTIDFKTKLNYRSKHFRSLNRNQRINQFAEYGFNQEDLVAAQREFGEDIRFNHNLYPNRIHFEGIEYGSNLLALKLATKHQFFSQKKDRELSIESSFLDTENQLNNYFQRYKSVQTNLSQTIHSFTFEAGYHIQERLINSFQLNGIQSADLSLKVSHRSDIFDNISYQFKQSVQSLRDTTKTSQFLDFANESEHSIQAKVSSESIQNSLQFTIRDRTIDPFFLGLTNQKKLYFNSAFTDSNYANNQSILIENNFRYQAYQRALNFSMNYRTGSELTAKRELVYQQVSPGFGNYRKEGEQFIPDDKGDYLRFVLPSNEFEPVTKINVLIQFKFNPSLYPFKQKIYTDFLSDYSFLTNLNLLEESRSEEREKLYLLDPTELLGDKSANASLQFNQYIYYKADNPDFNGELTYQNSQQVINTFVNDVSGENNRSRSYNWQLRFNYRISKTFRLSTAFRYEDRFKTVSLIPASIGQLM